MNLSEFFKQNLDFVIIFYGLSFLVMFLVIFAQRRKAAHFELLNNFKYLSLFALFHGIADVMVIAPNYLQLSKSGLADFAATRFTVFVLSFLFLLYFGLQVVVREERNRRRWVFFLLPYLVIVSYSIFSRVYVDPKTAIVIGKRFLNLPADLLAFFAFLRMYSDSKRLNLAGLDRSFLGAAVGFLFYAFFAGLLTTTYPDVDGLFGIPTQVFRAISATSITVFVARLLAVFEVEPASGHTAKEIPT